MAPENVLRSPVAFFSEENGSSITIGLVPDPFAPVVNWNVNADAKGMLDALVTVVGRHWLEWRGGEAESVPIAPASAVAETS